MKIFNNLQEWSAFRRSLNQNLGFAPTMGNLHKGHLSLFKRSKAENSFTASSLFVNPTQFNQAEDYKNYPRTLENDLQLMTEMGVDFCILPQEKEIYSDGYNYQIQENNLCRIMEGKHRPGHFNGVLTVVMKLLHLVKPSIAYFGEKDYQQYLLIKGMAEAFFIDTLIQPCPTIREASGLAYSSRNNRLSPAQRKQAEDFATVFHQHDKTCAAIAEELRARGIKIDYIEDYKSRRYAAIFIDGIRLIDNYKIDA